MSLPKELEEAAEIDGCNPFTTYWRIMLPLVVPAMLTLGVFTLMNTWNDYMGPLIYLSTPEKFTMTLGIAYFKGVYTTQWNLVMAGLDRFGYPDSGRISLRAEIFHRGDCFQRGKRVKCR